MGTPSEVRLRRVAAPGIREAREEGNAEMTSREFRSIFWDDLAADLEDPAFRDAYRQTTAEIAAIDWAENERRDTEAKPTSTSE